MGNAGGVENAYSAALEAPGIKKLNSLKKREYRKRKKIVDVESKGGGYIRLSAGQEECAKTGFLSLRLQRPKKGGLRRKVEGTRYL